MRRTVRFYSSLYIAAHVLIPIGFALAMSGPLYINDYALMIYFERKASAFFAASGNFWGYDPFYFAGYPLNFTWNSNVVLQFLAVLFKPMPEYALLLTATVASVVIAPLVFFLGLANFGIDGPKRSVALIVMTAYWWSGLPVVMMLLGMPAALFVFHLSFYTVSLFYRFFTRDDPRATALLYLFAPLCFLAHKTAVVLIGMPAALLFILNLKQINFKKISHLAGIAALVLAFNSFWLVPFLHLAKYKVTLAEAPHGLSYDPLRIFKDYFTLSKIMGHKVLVADKNTFVMVFLNTILRDLLLVCGALGIVDWLRSGKKRPAAFFAGIVLFFLALIYFGSFWGLSAQLNPTRYIGYLDFFLAVPASAGVAAVWRLLTRTSERRAKNISKFAAVCLLVFLIPAVAPYAFFFRQLNKRLDPDTHGLTEFLKTNSPAGERIMLEDSGWNDSDGAPPKYGESHFPALLSDITGREFIGGPYPYVFLRHHYADFHDGKFLQKKLSEYTDAEMRAALDSYNVGNIVCWSDECKNYFGRRESDFSKTGSFGKFLVYRRNSFTPSPFLVGSGYVFADHRGIRCYGLEPVNGKIVLKYHFYEGLVSDGGRISRTAVGHDPIGFIRIDNPAENLTIFNSYKW